MGSTEFAECRSKADKRKVVRQIVRVLNQEDGDVRAVRAGMKPVSGSKTMLVGILCSMLMGGAEAEQTCAVQKSGMDDWYFNFPGHAVACIACALLVTLLWSQYCMIRVLKGIFRQVNTFVHAETDSRGEQMSALRR